MIRIRPIFLLAVYLAFAVLSCAPARRGTAEVVDIGNPSAPDESKTNGTRNRVHFELAPQPELRAAILEVDRVVFRYRDGTTREIAFVPERKVAAVVGGAVIADALSAIESPEIQEAQATLLASVEIWVSQEAEATLLGFGAGPAVKRRLSTLSLSAQADQRLPHRTDAKTNTEFVVEITPPEKNTDDAWQPASTLRAGKPVTAYAGAIWTCQDGSSGGEPTCQSAEAILPKAESACEGKMSPDGKQGLQQFGIGVACDGWTR